MDNYRCKLRDPWNLYVVRNLHATEAMPQPDLASGYSPHSPGLAVTWRWSSCSRVKPAARREKATVGGSAFEFHLFVAPQHYFKLGFTVGLADRGLVSAFRRKKKNCFAVGITGTGSYRE